MEYTASVSSSMYFDGKGNRLDSLNVDVNGYTDYKALSEAVTDYNTGNEIMERWERAHEGLRPSGSPNIRMEDWRSQLWWILYGGMIANLRRWRGRKV